MLYSSIAIGNVFRRIRKRHLDKPNLTQAGMVIGVSNTAMGDLEKGASHAWSRERIQKLCEFYGIAIKDFEKMCKAEDEHLDSTTRNLSEAQPTTKDEDYEERKRRFIQAVTPAIEHVINLHNKLLEELPPKVYQAELNAIALKHGIDL